MRRFGVLLAITLSVCLFPLHPTARAGFEPSLVPKESTQARGFLERFSEYDGRGVLVAIFDNGVDPSAAGLQNTPQGEPKIVDLIDATGSGDVDMTTERKLTEGRQVEGLTGRLLVLPEAWSISGDVVRVGAKPAFELFPDALLPRIRREMRERLRPEHERLLLETEMRRDALAQDVEVGIDGAEAQLDEWDARLEALEAEWSAFSPAGPVYDCVSFHDGERWRAVVDSDADGVLADELVLTDFDVEPQFGSFGLGTELRFAVHFYDGGDTLSLVVNSGDHGTHVAGIVAAYRPDAPALNGVAPGAQLISVKIGDSRLGTMETALAIQRGVRAAVDHGCDLVNMSYGEPTRDPVHGFALDAIREAVNDHNLLFVASAGNSGPGFGTVGAPGGTLGETIGVGALVDSDMAVSQYGNLGIERPGLYTWSSRGPTADGAWGVDIVAPGGALASVPMWAGLQAAQKNGTSMSSPNACGALALVLSGLRAEGRQWTSIRVRQALKATARPVGNESFVDQGAGEIQALDLYSFLVQEVEAPWLDVPLEVNVDLPGSGRGAMITGAAAQAPRAAFGVRMRPRWDETATARTRWGFLHPLRLDATEAWVGLPGNAYLAANGGDFQVQIPLKDLKSGTHFAEIRVYHADHPEMGPLARIPVTVSKPETLENVDKVWSREWELKPQELRRFSVSIPAGSHGMRARLTRLDDLPMPRRVSLTAIQRVPGQEFERAEIRSTPSLEHGDSATASLRLLAGDAVEVSVGSYWSNSEPVRVRLDLTWDSWAVSASPLVLREGDVGTEVVAQSWRSGARLQPRGQLATLARAIPPHSHSLRLLSDPRDRSMSGQPLRELALGYSFAVDTQVTVTPRFSALKDRLYELPLSGPLWILEDENGQLIRCDDAWPDPVTLRPGEYQLRAKIWGYDRDALARWEALPLRLDMRLPKGPSLSFSETPETLLGGGRFRGEAMDSGRPVTFWARSPGRKDLPDWARPGDWIEGSVSYGSDADRFESANSLAGGFPVVFVPSWADEGATGEVIEIPEEEALESLIASDAKARRLDRLADLREAGDLGAFESYAAELDRMNGMAFEVALERLRSLDDAGRKQRLDSILEQARAALTIFDQADDEVKEGASDVDRAETLYRLLRALAYRDDERLEQDPEAELDPLFEERFEELDALVDTEKPEYLLVHLRAMRRRGELGQALRLLDSKKNELPPQARYYRKRERLLEELGWELWRAAEVERTAIRLPKWENRL